MKSLVKYMIISMFIGGSLPLIFHPLGITVFGSANDFLMHILGALIAGLIVFGIWKLKKLK